MGANCGWVKLHRKIIDNPYWQSEPFSRGQAWVDLLLMANHKPGFVRKQGVRVDLSPGDIGMSETELAARWQWSRGKVRRFVEELEVDGMIERKNTETDRRKFIVSICNYSKYQDQNSADGTGDGPTTVQANLPKSGNSAENSKKRGTGDGPAKISVSDQDYADIETSRQGDGTGDNTSDGPTTVQATDRRRYKNKNGKNEENEKKRDSDAAHATAAPLDCPHEQIIAIYHEVLPQCPRVKTWGEPSRKVLRARWREDKDRQDLGWWKEFFAGVATSDFLTGKVNGSKSEPFVASLNWLLKPMNMEKVLNGTYGQRSHCGQKIGGLTF